MPEDVFASYASLVTAFRQVSCTTDGQHWSLPWLTLRRHWHSLMDTTCQCSCGLGQVELANVRSFYKEAQKSPFASFPWKQGTMHFHYVPQVRQSATCVQGSHPAHGTA